MHGRNGLPSFHRCSRTLAVAYWSWSEPMAGATQAIKIEVVRAPHTAGKLRALPQLRMNHYFRIQAVNLLLLLPGSYSEDPNGDGSSLAQTNDYRTGAPLQLPAITQNSMRSTIIMKPVSLVGALPTQSTSRYGVSKHQNPRSLPMQSSDTKS
jgi:hypothetical protein